MLSAGHLVNETEDNHVKFGNNMPTSSISKQTDLSWAAEFFVVGIFFALLTIAALWPLALHINEQFVGDYQGDFWKHLWGHWWVQSCLSKGQVPLFCDMLNAPRGGYLFIADPCNAIFVYLFSTFCSLASAYNLTVMFNLWLGLIAAWMLIRHFVKDGACAMTGAVVYGLSAYVLSYPVLSGVTETLNTAWAPLYILFLHRLLEKGRLCDICGAAVFFALTAFSCWYYGEFMAVYTSVALGASLIMLLKKYWRGQRSFTQPLWRSARVRKAIWLHIKASWKRMRALWLTQVMKTAAAIIMGAILISPFAWFFKMTVSNSANIVMPRKAPKRSVFNFKDYLGEAPEKSINKHGVRGFHNYTNLLGLVLPGKGGATVTETVDRLIRVHYLGWIALFLSFLAWHRGRRKSQLYYWTTVFCFFIVLSLGPRIVFSDFSGMGVINPLYLFMFLFFPFFYNLAIPFRFLMLALIGLSQTAACGTKELLSEESVGRKWFFCGFIGCMIVAEIIFVSPLPWPLPMSPAEVPSYYRMLACDPRSYAIIDYPFERSGNILVPSEYFYYQTVHHKRIPYRTSGVLSPEVVHNSFMEEVLWAHRDIEPSHQSRKRILEGAKALFAMGFYVFILHENLLPDFAAQEIESRLTPVLGEPMRLGDGLIVYSLDLNYDK
ncbi:MAG: hypothetical protein ACI376_05645 [Candidatus Bruticola sp.]